jgi:hypothetical protein
VTPVAVEAQKWRLGINKEQDRQNKTQESSNSKVDKEDVPKTMGEEENNTQIQPYAREKKWKQRSNFLVQWKRIHILL